jgi:hypothetical protein
MNKLLLILAACAAALSMFGCGLMGRHEDPKQPTTTTPVVHDAEPSPAAASAGPRVYTDPDPQHPRTPPALRASAAAFYSGYVAYLYGRSHLLPPFAAPAVLEQLRRSGAIPQLRALRPKVTEIYLHFLDDDRVTGLAVVRDGRETPQSIPATFQLDDGQWTATGVAEGES